MSGGCSVIAYTLLCGYSPFRSEDKGELVKETMRGRIVFHERYWKNVSQTGESRCRLIGQTSLIANHSKGLYTGLVADRPPKTSLSK